MAEPLLTLLRWCLLALLYLFFFRVLQATWATTATTDGRRRGRKTTATKQPAATPVPTAVPAGAPAAGSPPPPMAASVLVVVEPDELAGRSFPLGGTLSIGRAAGCEITLDDTYISQVHARVLPGESGLLVEDLGSTNGTYLNRQRVTVPVVAHAGDRLQVGSIVMEFR
ncbi:MAG: FHA domain-containing protein [Acidimicrobiales bacterium]